MKKKKEKRMFQKSLPSFCVSVDFSFFCFFFFFFCSQSSCTTEKLNQPNKKTKHIF